ncbi:PREDICTED: uncharacterized protein LOC106746931 [Dinoponera quadriceps]|uniref:Uncharacterized protein LOC106746931 n=1 Tax=Dinoponera quadriceps TaxID=609295 RepID=A0A6P3XNL8_DINQU|nr:PREDICTED: uncharacterized protein LOC106746931 [Dinoponera quadriceps]
MSMNDAQMLARISSTQGASQDRRKRRLREGASDDARQGRNKKFHKRRYDPKESYSGGLLATSLVFNYWCRAKREATLTAEIPDNVQYL